MEKETKHTPECHKSEPRKNGRYRVLVLMCDLPYQEKEDVDEFKNGYWLSYAQFVIGWRELVASEHIDFLREYAKCGIYHNYTNPEGKLKTMNEAVNYLTSLQSEVDRLTKENERLQTLLDGARKSISDFKDPLKRRKF